jgi:hypothetical protein
MDLLGYALERYVSREPGNADVWTDLAAVQAALKQNHEALQSLKHAVENGGERIRDVVRKDRRFDPLREMAEFKALVPPTQVGLPGGSLPGLPLF